MNIDDLIQYSSESSTLDFKREQYPIATDSKKHELLKDISAMANNPDDADKYIIIGVIEQGGVFSSCHPIGDPIDEANYRQYINSYIEPEINFEYRIHEYKGKQLAFFKIFKNQDRPYLIKKEVKYKGKVEYREGDGFIRVGTSTRRINRSDLDRFYESKHVGKDRKSDLVIKCYTEISDIKEYRFERPHCLEFTIANTSNKSIEFDVQVIVPMNNIFYLTKRTDAINKFRKSQRDNSIFNYMMVSGVNRSDYFEDEEDLSGIEMYTDGDYYIINCEEPITLSQQHSISEILCKEILVDAVNEVEEMTIEGTVVIRSNDFTTGPLRQPFCISMTGPEW